MKHEETQEEFLESWYGWLARRLSSHPAAHSTNKAYIKFAFKMAIEQAQMSGLFEAKKDEEAEAA